MTRPRWKKVLSDLWGHKLRSLLIVASITVGLFALGIIATFYLVISADMQAGYLASNPANIQISLPPFGEDLVKRLSKIEGVRDVVGARRFNLRLEANPGDWKLVDMNVIPKGGSPTVNMLRLLEGRYPAAKDEIAIERYKLGEANASLGDWVTFELPSGKTRQLRVVGVVNDQTVGSFATVAGGFFMAPIQGYVIRETLPGLEQPFPDDDNTIFATVAENGGDKAHIQMVANRLLDELDRIGIETINFRTRRSTEHPNLTFVDALVGILLFLGLMVVFLSTFLITNSLQALMRQQTQQIGIMKTLGARRRLIISIYLILIFIFGALGALIAVPLAYEVAFIRAKDLAMLLNSFFRGPRVLPEVVILQVTLGIFTSLLAGLAPVLQGAKISVQEALSGIRQDAAPKQGWLDRQFMRLRGFSRPTIIAVRNTFRRKGRLVLTMITLSLGGALFIAAFNVQVSMVNFVDQIGRYFLADVNLTLDRSYRIREMENLLAGVPGVGQVEGWAMARSEVILPDGTAGESVQLLAVPAESDLLDPIITHGRWIKPGDQNAIVLTDMFRVTFPDLQVGETLRLRVNGEETEWVVVGFYKLAGRSGGLMAYTTYDYLSTLIQQPNRAMAFRVVADRPDLTAAEQDQLGMMIDAALREQGVRVVDINTGSWLTKVTGEGFNALIGVLLFLAMLTALVGSIGLAGTMSMNVMERTREIGVMRAIGATDRILFKMVLTEGLFIGMLSWLFGSLISFPVSVAMSDMISYSLFNTPSTFGISASGFAIWFGVVLVLSALASLLPARNATRLTIREVLAYE